MIMSSLPPSMRVYSFLSSVKRRENKRELVKHKPASMRVIVFITDLPLLSPFGAGFSSMDEELDFDC